MSPRPEGHNILEAENPLLRGSATAASTEAIVLIGLAVAFGIRGMVVVGFSKALEQMAAG